MKPIPLSEAKQNAAWTLQEAVRMVKAIKARVLLQGDREAAQDAIEYIGLALTALADVDDETKDRLN